MAEKRQKSECLKHSTSDIPQQCQNKVSFQIKGSSVESNFLLSEMLELLSIHKRALSTFQRYSENSVRRQSPFFENLLYFDIAGGQSKWFF